MYVGKFFTEVVCTGFMFREVMCADCLRLYVYIV